MPLTPAESHEREWRWYQPWVALGLFSLLLNVVWEFFAISFYDTPPQAIGGNAMVASCLLAAIGDVGITLASYAAASVTSTRRWIARSSITAFTTYVASGLFLTIIFEYVNVYVLHRWSYRSDMPTFMGIGVMPLFQWLVLPPIVLSLTRRHLARAQTMQPPQEII